MAVAFANNWDIIISKLESLFRAEFKGALKVYSGLQNEMEGNQYLRLSPISSSLIDYSTTLETREFVIGMALYFNEPNIKKAGIDNVMRLVSRIETIIANNNSITLPDSSVAYDCKIESSEIEASDSEYLVQFNFRCTHANSISYPTVAITASEVVDGASSDDSSLSLTFKTSHATTDFIVGDVSVTNGSLGSISGSGTTYTATFTPTSGGATTIQVVAGKFSDYSGNKNTASDVFNWTYIEKFISTWTLTGADTVTLPLVSGSDGVYNFDIDWGDGGATETITAYDQSEVTHSYGSEGVKTITIGGTNNTIKGWQFDNTGDKTLITGISNWGTLNISTNDAFYGCSALNVTAGNAPTISSTDLSGTFYGCTALTSIGGDWDVSNVNNFTETFRSCSNFNQDIGDWDTSKVTTTYRMFNACSAFNQNLGAWDMSSNTYMREMFKACGEFNNGGSDTINNWNVTAVTNFSQMFTTCSKFNQPLDDWTLKTSASVDMSHMFSYTTIFNQTLNSWNTSSVTNMSYMFLSATNFNGNITSWNTAAVTTMYSMFRLAAAFNQNIGEWKTGATTNMSYMFNNATNFNQDIGDWNTSSVTNMFFMFAGASTFNQDIGDWNTSSATNMGYMLYATAFNQNIEAWTVAQVTVFTSFLEYNTAMSTANWNLFLIRVEATSSQSGVYLHGGDANATGDGAAKRLALENDHSWVIVDGDG